MQQFLVGLLQRFGDLADNLDQLAAGDGHTHNVPQKRPDGREGRVAGSFHEGNQGRQLRPRQTTALDVDGHWSGVTLVAPIAPERGKGVLLDGDRWLLHVNLLDNYWWVTRCPQGATAVGTASKLVSLEVSDLLRWKGDSVVFGVSGLAPNGSFDTLGYGWLGLDNVRGRGLGGVGGVLLGCCQLFLQRVSLLL